jgi:hypothetical protein
LIDPRHGHQGGSLQYFGITAEMPSHISDPAHWRRRADEARCMADLFRDDAAKRTLMDIAASYEEVAKLVESSQASERK